MDLKDKKILIHTCCAPCATYVFEVLKSDGAKITSFFYNPNIHGQAEYERRKKSIEKLSKKMKVKIYSPKYDMREFFDALYAYEKGHHRRIENDRKRRCGVCFDFRLRKTAELAKKKGFDYFSTTLLISPYQDQSHIWHIGVEIGDETHVPFYFRDFRKGYLQSRHKAKRDKLYLQDYCGCSYSAVEKIKV